MQFLNLRIAFRAILNKIFLLFYYTAIISVSLYFATIGIRHIFLFFESKNEVVFLNEMLEKQKQENARLIEEEENLNFDFYWEYLARKQLGFVKRDETVYKILY